MGIFDEASRRFTNFIEDRKSEPVKLEEQSSKANGNPYRTVLPEDMAMLEQSGQRQEIGLNFRLAETIMNRENYQGYMGQEQVKVAFGIDLDPKLIPEIPFSETDLEKAKELGQFLVLRVNKAPDGQPLVMKKMNQILQPKFNQSNKGRVL